MTTQVDGRADQGLPAGPAHDQRTTVVVGRLLGLAVLVCFLTGLLSHYLQQPPSWLHFPTRPVWGYRLTQGLHIAVGTAAVPLLLAKLYLVYPRFFRRPSLGSLRAALGDGAERASILVLVGSMVLQLFTGYLNTLEWYFWPFPFRQTHYALSFLIVAALATHVAVKLPVIAQVWRRPARGGRTAPDGPGERPVSALRAGSRGLSRRQVLLGTGLATGGITLVTVGQSVTPLGRLALLSPRSPLLELQGLPVTTSAASAGVAGMLDGASWQLEVSGPTTLRLGLAQLQAMPQTEVTLPIACVDGWSKDARWSGVRVRDLVRAAGGTPRQGVVVESLQPGGPYATYPMPREYVWDPDTLLALRINGEQLHPDHGFPARVVAPNRPGVTQTKWVRALRVQA